MSQRSSLDRLLVLAKANRLVVEAEQSATPAPPASPPQTTAPAPTKGASQTPPTPTQNAPATASAGDEGGDDQAPTIDSVVEQLNALRAGRSLKDQAVLTELGRYFDSLEDAEKSALHSYLKGIAQIMSGQVDAGAAEEPSAHGVESKATGQKVRTIKPSIVRSKGKPSASSPGVDRGKIQAATSSPPKEDTTAPRQQLPIQPKNRIA